MADETVAQSDDAAKSQATPRFLIRLNVSREEQDGLWELGEDIERLGGVLGNDGFQFASRQRRDEAVDILIARWGQWYLDSANADDIVPARLLLASSRGDDCEPARFPVVATLPDPVQPEMLWDVLQLELFGNGPRT